MNQEPSTYDIRIPDRYLSMLHEGEVTPAMLLTLTVLYKWANWTTGRVKQCSAGGLATWTNKAYSVRTFSEALRKLELMGEITRRTVPGRHKDYPVILHNYKKYDDAGNVQVINPKATRTWEDVQQAQCDDASDETSSEGSEEASEETSEKVLSENKSETISENQSENLSQNGDSESDKQPEPSAPRVYGFSDLAKMLLNEIQPIRNAAHENGDLALLDEMLKLIPENINPLHLLQYNHWHKKGGLYIRSAQQFLDAILGKDGGYHLLNEYWTHDTANCKDCKNHGITANAPEIWASKCRREADAAWQEAEARREAALATYEFRPVTKEEQAQFKDLRGDGWEDGILKKRVAEKMWDKRYVDAAILCHLKVGEPVSFEAFSYMVDGIRSLDAPTPSAT